MKKKGHANYYKSKRAREKSLRAKADNFYEDDIERVKRIKELFPERVLKDYQLLASIHPELLEVAPRISKSQTVQNAIIKLACQLLKIKGV